MIGDIEDRLLSSDAVRSLSMEAEVTDVLSCQGWNATQGAYYNDPVTSKAREIDVHAYKVFLSSKGKNQTKNPIVDIDLLVECKNLSGYNLVFNSMREVERRVPMYWTGFGEEISHLINKIIQVRPDLNAKQISAIREHFVRRGYPDDLAIAGYGRLCAPTIAATASAFRETDTKNIRDENSSVIWKASITLLSATDSIISKRADRSRSEFMMDYEKYILEDPETAFHISHSFDGEVSKESYCHPVLVVQSSMFQIVPNGLRKIEEIRLLFVDVSRSLMFSKYVDIVQRSKVEEYIKRVSAEFDNYINDYRERFSKRTRKLKWKEGKNWENLHQLLQKQSL